MHNYVTYKTIKWESPMSIQSPTEYRVQERGKAQKEKKKIC